MTVLILAGVVAFWHIVIAALFMGSMMAMVMPARQALVAQVVPQHKLMNAISLQMGGMNLTRIIGPGLGGLLLAIVGVGWAYAATVVLFFLGVLCMFPLPKEGMIAKQYDAENPRNFLEDLLGGMKFVISSPLFRLLLATALLMPLFAFPVQQILPVFAEEVFSWPDVGLAILASSAGAGGLLGTLIAANLDHIQRKGRVMLFGGLLMAFTFIGFAFVPNFWVASLLLGVGNTGAMLFMVTNNTIIQAKVPDEYRGRVMSLLMMSFGLMLVGILPLTIASDLWGVDVAVGGLAFILLADGDPGVHVQRPSAAACGWLRLNRPRCLPRRPRSSSPRARSPRKRPTASPAAIDCRPPTRPCPTVRAVDRGPSGSWSRPCPVRWFSHEPPGGAAWPKLSNRGSNNSWRSSPATTGPSAAPRKMDSRRQANRPCRH
ncbi:MAG: MFS transporter [Dehalococcoidia bacterium]|nr:MFS transporter [Dehalococcoidia bacterium]